MRFVLGLWLLILGSLLIFTLVLFFHELFAQDLPEVVQKAILLAAAWVTGLVSAAAIHLLHRRAEKVSQRAARDQTVVQLAGAVAHELKSAPHGSHQQRGADLSPRPYSRRHEGGGHQNGGRIPAYF